MSAAPRVETGVGSAGNNKPYLSVVVTTRNDDHGGGMLERMQVFVDALVAQCVRHRLDAELVLVEWNPPGDRPRLIDAVRWPEGAGYLTVRIIEVPHELHARFEHSKRLPIFQMIAKNVGIRRACAPFVLATNIDLLFSDGVMRTLGSQALRQGRVYRVDRYDVEAGVPVGGPVSDQLRWCSEHVLRINGRRGTADLTTGAFYPIYSGFLDFPAYAWHRLKLRLHPPRLRRVARVSAPARGVSMARPTSLDLRRGDFVGRARRVIRRRILKRRIAARRRAGRPPGVQAPAHRDLLPRAFGRIDAALLRVHAVPSRAKEKVGRMRRSALRARIRPHTNACGDFTLLARDDWLVLRGYPELEIFSLHIDSLLMYMSRLAGLQERVLPDAVFHIEHGTGFKPDDEARRDLFGRLRREGIPWMTSERFAEYVVEMIETRRPLDLNGDNWGLAAEALPEQIFVL